MKPSLPEYPPEYPTPYPHVVRPCLHGDALIQALLGVKTVYRLTLRALQGFTQSLRALAFQSFPVPNYATLDLCNNAPAAVLARQSRRAVLFVVLLAENLFKRGLDMAIGFLGRLYLGGFPIRAIGSGNLSLLAPHGNHRLQLRFGHRRPARMAPRRLQFSPPDDARG
ncbi:MAG: hypothetical protein E5299_00701 [Burkholderia gladioli]|nr:MAG: hypothetical protein E5299_00701 [Burkholderia gladioli]